MASGSLDRVCLSAPMPWLSAPSTGTLVGETDTMPGRSLAKNALFLFQGVLRYTAPLKHFLSFHLCLKRQLICVVQKSRVSSEVLALSSPQGPFLREPVSSVSF